MECHIGSQKHLKPVSTGFLGHFVDPSSMIKAKPFFIEFFEYGGNIGSTLSETDQLHLIIRLPGRHLFTFVLLISSSKPKASTRICVGWNPLEISGSPEESSDTMIRKISWFGIYKMLISEALSSELPLPHSFVPE